MLMDLLSLFPCSIFQFLLVTILYQNISKGKSYKLCYTKIWLIYDSCNLIGWEHFQLYKTENLHKPSFMFLESISAWLKSNWFINSYLKYGWFKKAAIWLAEKIFNKAYFANLYQHAKNQVDSSIFSWDIADLRIM